MIWLALLLACGRPALPAPKKPCGEWSRPGTYDLDLKVGDRTRTARVYVPRSSGPRDLVVALHGLKGSSGTMASATDFDALARKEGFVVAYPQGVGWPLQTSWNAGTCCEGAKEANVPDVAFLDALTAELERRTCTNRVLAAGFSNGAGMVQRWACESKVVDAVISVGAPRMVDTPCPRPIPIRHYHGTADPIVPMEGRTEEPLVPPLEEQFELWKRDNRCRGKPKTTENGGMTCRTYRCEAHTEICILQDWKHRWPGGPLAQDAGLDATTEALRFLRANAGRQRK